MHFNLNWRFGNIMKRFLLTLFLFPVLLNAQDSKGLLVEAIQSSNKLSSNLSIEQRLDIYEEIEQSINKIINDYPSSDEAIRLSSGEVIGNFNYNKIKHNYFSELTDYYSKVCKVAPSFSCIAAVSLDSGNKACIKSKTFYELEIAHANIKNALKILNSQNSDPSLINAGLSAYRGCSGSSRLTSSQTLKDYFDSELIELYLDIGDENQARAIIQKMQNPYLKFSGVLSLQSYLGKVDRAYVKRMKEYIDERIPYEFKNIARSRLYLEELKQSNYRISETDLGFSINGGGTLTEREAALSLGIEIVDATFNRLNLPELKKSQKKFLKPQSMDLFGYISDEKTGRALQGYIYIKQISSSKADSFLQYSKTVNYDNDLMMEYIFNLQEEQPEFNNRFINRYFDDFYNVKTLVREGKLCDAISKIFQDFQGGPNFQKAIAYLIESPSVNKNKKYDCGDADLELLLGYLN